MCAFAVVNFELAKIHKMKRLIVPRHARQQNRTIINRSTDMDGNLYPQVEPPGTGDDYSQHEQQQWDDASDDFVFVEPVTGPEAAAALQFSALSSSLLNAPADLSFTPHHFGVHSGIDPRVRVVPQVPTPFCGAGLGRHQPHPSALGFAAPDGYLGHPVSMFQAVDSEQFAEEQGCNSSPLGTAGAAGPFHPTANPSPSNRLSGMAYNIQPQLSANSLNHAHAIQDSSSPEANDSQDGQGQGKPHRRGYQACQNCRSRKVKCDLGSK